MRIVRPGFTVPANVPKAGNKDPRFVTGANNPSFQPDMAQFQAERQALNSGNVQQYSEAAAALQQTDFSAQTIPTRMQYITWTLSMSVANVPQLIVPKNLSRLSLILVNPLSSTISATAGYSFSFGYPPLNNAGQPIGFTLQPQTMAIWDGNVIPINDVYFWPEPGVDNHTSVAYEGLPAPESNT